MSDGRTLTGEVTVTGIPSRAQAFALVFTKGDGTVRRHDTEAARPVAGRFRIAVPLEGRDSADLRAGRWRVGLAVSAGRDARTLPLRSLGFDDDDERGPTLANPRSPVSGRRYRPGADKAGTFILTAKAYAPHAEVDRVTVRDTAVDIAGRLIGKGVRDVSGATTVVLQQTTSGERREVPGRVTKRAFFFSIPGHVLRHDGRRTIWSATLQVKGTAPQALRKRLSDVRDLGEVIRYPAATLPDGTKVVPGYASDGSLELTVTPPPPGQAGSQESPA